MWPSTVPTAGCWRGTYWGHSGHRAVVPARPLMTHSSASSTTHLSWNGRVNSKPSRTAARDHTGRRPCRHAPRCRGYLLSHIEFRLGGDA
jgi:hypothetical protein